MNTKVISSKVMELVNSGISMEEALEKVLKESNSIKITDRVAYISGLDNIEEVRKALKTAYAKKSKQKDSAVAVARYEKEIEAAKSRLNELNAEASRFSDPILGALELGESHKSLVQLFIILVEEKVNHQLEKYRASKDLSRKAMKNMVNSVTVKPNIFYSLLEKYNKHNNLGKHLYDIVAERYGNGDQRVVTLAKKIKLLASIKANTKASK